ncbi:MAG: tetratricopeptide repeat protein, partial [Gloeomargarita sp. DG_1_5_bins_55]
MLTHSSHTDAMVARLLLVISGSMILTPALSWAQTAPLTLPAPRPDVSQLLRQGRESMRRGDWVAALAVYQQVAGLSPSDGAVFAAIGYIHTQQRNWPAALEAYQRAVTLSPENTNFLNALALVQAELGEYLEASHNYHRSLRLDARQVT